MDVRIKNYGVHKFIFNIIEQNNKFQSYTVTFENLSFDELKDELEGILNNSNITSEHRQDDFLGPRIISAFKKLETEKRQTDGYYMLLLGYARSPFRDIESYDRIVVGLDEDNIRLTLKHNNSKFLNFEVSTEIHTIRDIAEVVYTISDHEGTLQMEYNDTGMKTKLILTRFDGTFVTLRFHGKSLFNTLLGFTTCWVYKTTNAVHADSPGDYTSDKLFIFKYNR